MVTLIETTRSITLISSNIQESKFSSSSSSSIELSTSPRQCPISSKLASHIRSTSDSSSNTCCPFSTPQVIIKKTTIEKPLSFLEVQPFYLPPLLSLLPTGTPSIAPTAAFNFDLPKVGYTTSRLPSVDPASVALHNALYHFKPISRDYAYSNYKDAFNWNELMLDIEVEREWYIVAFRSTRANGSISQNLYEADRQAHEEAVTAGGLLAYWFGAPNDQGSNLATCIWQSRAHAIAASSGEAHVQAMRLASSMYEIYSLERYVLKKVKGETGVTVEDWAQGRKEVKF